MEDYEYVEGKHDTSTEDVAECPWCGYTYDRWSAEELEDEGINYCEVCGEPFTVQSEETINFYCMRIKVKKHKKLKKKKAKMKKGTKK
jgi:hypothetical protein